MIRGSRKFIAFILSLLSFTAIIIVRPETDILAVGIGLTGILSSFGFSNAMTHKYDIKYDKQ